MLYVICHEVPECGIRGRRGRIKKQSSNNFGFCILWYLIAVLQWKGYPYSLLQNSILDVRWADGNPSIILSATNLPTRAHWGLWWYGCRYGVWTDTAATANSSRFVLSFRVLSTIYHGGRLRLREVGSRADLDARVSE